jgi:hypothetical protein
MYPPDVKKLKVQCCGAEAEEFEIKLPPEPEPKLLITAPDHNQLILISS